MNSQNKRKNGFPFRDINADYFFKKSKPVEPYVTVETERSKALKKEIEQIQKMIRKHGQELKILFLSDLSNVILLLELKNIDAIIKQ